jgi:hypothetical protein
METLVGADATDKELSGINEYDTFSDKGKVIVQDKIKKIRVHLRGQARRTSQRTSRRRTPYRNTS